MKNSQKHVTVMRELTPSKLKTIPKILYAQAKQWCATHAALFGMVVTILFSGCASIDQFYSENPYAKQMELIDYEGPLKAEPVVGMNLDQLIDARESEDYFPIGSADYTGPGNQDWTDAMVQLGQKLKAEKIDYYTWYFCTDSNTGVIPMPTTQNSTATVWGPNGLQTVNVTTTGTAMIPYSYNVPRNEYHVLYFKKIKHPPTFGIAYGIPNDEIAREIGTRNVLIIERVIPGKIAWKNDLFKGDVIVEVDGLKATTENVLSFCKNSNGKKMKIKRAGKEMEITIKAD